MPVPNILHLVQVLYYKKNGCVDGASQYRSVLRKPRAHGGWESNVLPFMFHSLVCNSFVAWRMHELNASEVSSDSYNDMYNYLQRLNKVSSLPDYIHDISCELLRYSDILSGHFGTHRISTTAQSLDEMNQDFCSRFQNADVFTDLQGSTGPMDLNCV